MLRSRFSQYLLVIVLAGTLMAAHGFRLAAQPSRERPLTGDSLEGPPPACPTGDPSELCDEPRSFETLASGTNGGVREEQYLVIRNAEEFLDLWRRIHRNRIPAPEPPELDFGRVQVIAAILGERPTGGYAVAVRRICADGLVAISRQEPEPGRMLTQALTAPYHLVVNDRPDPDRADGNAAGGLRFCTIPRGEP